MGVGVGVGVSGLMLGVGVNLITVRFRCGIHRISSESCGKDSGTTRQYPVEIIRIRTALSHIPQIGDAPLSPAGYVTPLIL
ncbi:hypothetical protein I4U23_005721 [Adineta vaga]|nr:hypothetical protein I4U23_005721 [Adineta vaga]